MIKNNCLVVLAFLLVAQTASAETYTADVWADNWFSLDVNGAQVAEVSVTTVFDALSITIIDGFSRSHARFVC